MHVGKQYETTAEIRRPSKLPHFDTFTPNERRARGMSREKRAGYVFNLKQSGGAMFLIKGGLGGRGIPLAFLTIPKMGYTWTPVKALIHELYVVQNRSLRQVMKHLEDNRYWANSGSERGPCARTFRDKLSKWGYLRKDVPDGGMEDEGADRVAGAGAGSSMNTTNSGSVAEDPNSVSLQVGYGGGAATTPSGLEFGVYPGTVQFRESGWENRQAEQLHCDDTQDCQHPECWAFQGMVLVKGNIVSLELAGYSEGMRIGKLDDKFTS
ncbi:unnamed protein product [Tuber aestivum]|uniref:Clr5 domain-containing protein n=1 Tax=Tuber aestivum TaxID=59557 RepID=A0A292PP59_9PEZI|nr:unnamed protein product [Tuber aestivum]